MRAKVAKRLRRLTMVLHGRQASESRLVHKNSSRGHRQYHVAVNDPYCGRYHYQKLKKEYYQERRHA